MFRAVVRWLLDLLADPPERAAPALDESPPDIVVEFVNVRPARRGAWDYWFAARCSDPAEFHGRLRLRLGWRGDGVGCTFRFDRKPTRENGALVMTSRLAPDRLRPWAATVHGFVVGCGVLPAKIAPTPAGE